MCPVLIDLGFIKVYSWGFMLALALLIDIWWGGKIFKKAGYDSDIVLDLVILLTLTGIIGARVGYVLVYEWDLFIANPWYLFKLTEGGLSGMMWYGGFTAGFIACVIYLRLKKLNFWEVADLIAPFLALSYAMVRVGCFLNGCCYGQVASFGGVIFPLVDNLPRHPTQLYSTAINLVLFAFLMYYYKYRKFKGEITAFYLMGYAVYRFIVEFFREGPIVWYMFTPGQTYSFFILPLGIAIYLYCRHKYYRP